MKKGDYFYDLYNEFCNPDFKFIEGQSYNPEMAKCEILELNLTSVLIMVEKHPLRIYIKDNSISSPIRHQQWFKLKREHEYEIGFNYRFKDSPNWIKLATPLPMPKHP